MSNVEIISTPQDFDLARIETGRADRNPFAVYIARLGSKNSRRAMTGALRKIADLLTSGAVTDPARFPWQDLRYQHAQAARSALAERYAPSTVNQALSALRGVLKECWRLELMSADDYQRTTDLAAVKGERIPAGREVSKAEAAALFAACPDTVIGARNAALLALLYGCGLRRAEVVALSREDFDAATGTLKLVGKGNKQRLAYVTNGAMEAMNAWLEIRGDRTGPLFCRVSKSGAIVLDESLAPAAISPQAAYLILDTVREAAGVAPFSPHDLRRTYAGDLLDAGADLVTVQALMGHASPTTTARYDRRGERTKQAASALHHTPYVARARAS